jgi:uncharacterized membrane protein
MTDPGLGPAGEDVPQSVARNIAAIRKWKANRRAKARLPDRIAAAISKFAGSMPFVYIHLVVFSAWIGINLGWIPGLPRWDASLVILAMEASVEAIFLSTFVLINQNQMAVEVDEKAELDLQVSLLNERETTRLITMVQAIADKMGVETGIEDDLSELRRDTEPNVILDAVRTGRED